MGSTNFLSIRIEETQMRRHFNTKGLVAAMEEEEKRVEAEGVPAEELEIAENAAETSEAVAEVSEGETELAESDAQMEEAEEVSETLTAVAECMAISAANGGMDKYSAQAVTIAVEHLYSRVGGRRPAMPAMESFGGTSSRIGATQLAMEDIKDKIREIWRAIVAQIKKAIAWVKDHFTKIFGAANKLEKRAKAIFEKADKTTDPIKETKIENERLVKTLYQGTDVAASAAGAELLKTVGNKVFSSYAAKSNDSGEAIANALEGVNKDTTIVDLLSKVTPALTSDIEGMSANTHQTNAPEGTGVKSTAELPGGRAIVSFMHDAKGFENISDCKIFLGDFNPGVKAPSKTSVDTMKAQECKKVASAIESLAVEIQGYKKQIEKVTKIKERVAKAAENIGKLADDATDATKETLRGAQKAVTYCVNQMDQPATAFSAYALKTGSAYLDYCEASLKNHGKK